MSKIEKIGEKRWIIEVEQAPDGDCFIQVNDEILEGSGFKIGDELDWKDNGDGSFTLTKKEPKVWVMVDAIQTFRMRYLVEAPADHPEYALDTVTCNEAKEFSQEALPEIIVSHRVVTEEEALKVCDVDNDYLKSWTKEQKIKNFFTFVDDKTGHSDYYYDTDRNK
jgi:hypothetical protein